MARSIGRDLKIQLGNTASPIVYTTVGTVQAKSFTYNREPVDVSTDDDSGFRVLLAQPGQKNIDISVEGALDAQTILAAMEGSPVVLQNVRILLPDAGTIDGAFFINSLEQSGPTNEASRYSAELQSAGAWVYTP